MPLICACDQPAGERCDLDAIESLRLDADDGEVVVNVQSGDLSSTANAGAVTISGSLSSDVRIERLNVGSAAAKGLTPNFASWSVELSQAQLQAARDGEFAHLSVVATDVCGVEHASDEVQVRVDAPAQSPAPGLKLTVTPSVPGECYVPIDGSGAARLLLEADLSAAGVRVELDAIVDGEFLGVGDAGVRLIADGDRAASSPVSFRAKAAGALALVASAGPDFVLDDSGLEAVSAPSFTGASGAVTAGLALVVRPRTNGRLARCWASSSAPAMVSVSGPGVADLLIEDAVFDEPDCEQEAVIDVQFDMAAAPGVQLQLWCADTYGQIGAHSLSVQG
ncbi:hypothetical protein DB30_06929 [Enhygromyxa salina]|uniref:Uncharacterized protein n=1 Tax=Enhygromyxa salina TaxID=215803 RepID=A0A0C2D2H3_9BACT|nr:hypothetical protein DB30_06929 [Enhygromyxa salina]